MLNTEHNEQVGNVAMGYDDCYPNVQNLEEVNVECFDVVSEISQPLSERKIPNFMERLFQNHLNILEYVKPNRDKEHDNKRQKIDRQVSLKSGRMDELLAFPQIYQDAVNSQNIDLVQNLINEYMLEDCLFKTPALSQPVKGRHYIISLLESIFRCVKHFQLTFNEVHLSEDKNIVIASGTGEGVVVRRDTSDNLWNDVANGHENVSYRDKVRMRIRRFFTNYIEDGVFSCGFAIKVGVSIIVHFVMNKEKTHFESIIGSRKSIKLRIVRPPA